MQGCRKDTMDLQIAKTFAALLEQEWVLDLDATVKTLYGHQEEARGDKAG